MNEAMYFLFKMGIFQPAMFVYRRVIQKAWLGLGSMLQYAIYDLYLPNMSLFFWGVLQVAIEYPPFNF